MPMKIDDQPASAVNEAEVEVLRALVFSLEAQLAVFEDEVTQLRERLSRLEERALPRS